MGCVNARATPEERAAIAQSQHWDKELLGLNKNDNRVVKVLLLGTGESGKSTILKQMKILYDEGFNAIDKETYKVVLRRNVVESMQTLLEGVEIWEYEFENKQSQESAEIINNTDGHNISMWNDDVAASIKQLWTEEPAIQKSYASRSKLQLLDSAQYLFKNVERMKHPKFVPNAEDILRGRLRTTGIVEEDVDVHGIMFRFLDVGGQRNERRKWIHCFSEVKAVIFVAAISEYDQFCYEDEERNRLDEALEVFHGICNNPAFKDAAMILFLNKKDIFIEKLKHVKNFGTIFKEFHGNPEDFNDTASFIEEKFMEQNEKTQKIIFTHLTCATDTENVQRVFEVCKLVILEANLAGVGLR